MNFRILLPNLFTSFNLFFGCAGIVLAFNEQLVLSACCIGIAAVCDFLDGFLARLVKGFSKFGTEMDSLADGVTFGVLPGVILYQFITIGFHEYYTPVMDRPFGHLLASMSAFIVSVFSAIRLAKFNIDERQKNSFLGLPTPANAILIASIPLIMGIQLNINFYSPPGEQVMNYLAQSNALNSMEFAIAQLLFNPWFFVVLSIVMSVLLVVEFPLFALKFKGYGWWKNKIRYSFLAISIFLLSTVYYTELYFLTIPIIIFLYIVISIGYYLIKGRI